MKKVLIIANLFPPLGGSGVQRTIKFVKYLRAFNWEPVVLTREICSAPLIDDTLLSDIPKGVKVFRTKPYNLAELTGIFALPGKFAARKLLIPDADRLWQMFSSKKAGSIVVNEKIDLIYTTSAPYSDHLFGLKLKKIFPSIPWIADFRDDRTNNPYTLDNPYNPVRTHIEKSMEKKVLTCADHLVTNTPIMLKNFINNNRAIANLNTKFSVIPNGFDSADFSHLEKSRPKNSAFTMTYTGLLYGRRKPDLLLKAVSELIKENKIQRNKILLRFIGNFKENWFNNLINGFDLNGVAKIFPYMNHKDVLINLSHSDSLLLIEGSGPGAEAFYTGKLFEYINIGRPILAVIPQNGVAAELVRKTKTGLVSDCNDIELTKVNILKLYADWLNDVTSIEPDWNLINRYERKSLTQKLSEIFDNSVELKMNSKSN